MYPTAVPHEPQSRGYVPYFYESGLYRTRPVTAGNHEAVEPVPSSYPMITALPPAGGPQTVEQIIARGYFAPRPGDPVTAILGDKRETAWLGLDDVLGQIRHRYDLYARNVHELELSKSAAVNSLYASWAYHGPPSEKQFYSMNKRVQDLYREQREERLNLWRDVSRLRLGLPEVIQQYLTAHRKLDLLDQPGDAP